MLEQEKAEGTRAALELKEFCSEVNSEHLLLLCLLT